MTVRSGVHGILRILPLAYMGLIWFLSSKPPDAVIEFGFYDSVIKESLHLVEFGVLYGFWILAFLTKGRLSPAANWLSCGISAAYALVDELHQAFVPQRTATPVDFAKDLLGILLVWYIVNRSYFRRTSSELPNEEKDGERTRAPNLRK